MRRMGRGLALAAALLGLIGCTGPDRQIKPPKVPEEYKLPPDDLRFSQPPRFPKDTLNQDLIQPRNSLDGPAGPKGGMPGRPGGSMPGGR